MNNQEIFEKVRNLNLQKENVEARIALLEDRKEVLENEIESLGRVLYSEEENKH